LKYKINDIILLGCYHPSPRNVNTRRINEKMMIDLFNKAKKLG
jgi:uracil-DNA glycosylase